MQHVSEELTRLVEAEHQGADEASLLTAFEQRLTGAVEDAREMNAARLERGDFLSITVKVERDGAEPRTGTYGLRPEPAGLLSFCALTCQPGDRVTVTQELVGGSTKAADTWPFSLEAASDMVGAPTMAAAAENGEERHIVRLRNGAKVAHFTSSGPPKWDLPKVKVSLKDSKGKRRLVSVMVGWRYTCHSFHYLPAS